LSQVFLRRADAGVAEEMLRVHDAVLLSVAPGAPPSVFGAGDFSSQFPIDNPVTNLLHYPRKVVRLAFRETPLTT